MYHLTRLSLIVSQASNTWACLALAMFIEKPVFIFGLKRLDCPNIKDIMILLSMIHRGLVARMGQYYCVRVWQLKAEVSAAEVELFASTGLVELQRWIPGVEHLSILRLSTTQPHYLMIFTFTDQTAYHYWRQVEIEAPDYWERFAAIVAQWEQLCVQVAEYVGEQIMDIGIADGVWRNN